MHRRHQSSEAFAHATFRTIFANKDACLIFLHFIVCGLLLDPCKALPLLLGLTPCLIIICTSCHCYLSRAFFTFPHNSHFESHLCGWLQSPSWWFCKQGSRVIWKGTDIDLERPRRFVLNAQNSCQAVVTVDIIGGGQTMAGAWRGATRNYCL